MMSLRYYPGFPAPVVATIAVPLVAAMLAAGIYLAASATASRAISTLSTAETLRHARAVEFDTTAMRATAENRTAHERCAFLEAHERVGCGRAADRRQRIAIRGL
jgi:hypothetical protein